MDLKDLFSPTHILRTAVFVLAGLSLTACRLPASVPATPTTASPQGASPQGASPRASTPAADQTAGVAPALSTGTAAGAAGAQTAATGPVPVTGPDTGTPGSPTAIGAATATISGLVPNTGQQIYVVQTGDNLSSIAARFGLTVGELEAANPQILNPNLIYTGQSIFIPAVRATATILSGTTTPGTGTSAPGAVVPAPRSGTIYPTAPAFPTAPSPTPVY